MIKNKLKLCSVATLLALALPIAANAASSSDAFSYGSMKASALLKCTWSAFSYDKGVSKTTFTSSSSTNSGYSVTSYLEAQASDGDVIDSSFDKGTSWAEADLSKKSVNRYNSTHSIANSNNVYNPLNLTQLSDS